MSINLCQFIGNLGQDPDLRYMPDGRAVVNLSIACSERWKDKQTGETKESTEWIRAVCFGKRAQVIAEHFKKGSQIYVSGKMRTRQYEQDGIKRYSTEIVVEEFQFCGNRSGNGDTKAQQQAAAYDRSPVPKGVDNPSVSAYSGDAGSYDDFDDQIPF